jgi:hypothetical protein
VDRRNCSTLLGRPASAGHGGDRAAGCGLGERQASPAGHDVRRSVRIFRTAHPHFGRQRLCRVLPVHADLTGFQQGGTRGARPAWQGLHWFEVIDGHAPNLADRPTLVPM